MPRLSGPVQAQGALVEVRVGWSALQAAGLRMALQPVPPAVDTRALLDTGAEVTCLDATLVHALGLPVAGFTLANLPVAGGTTIGTQHFASLTVVHPSGNPRQDLVVSDLLAVELSLRTLGYEVLIGRDVLAVCDFLYSGRRGRFRLGY
jgi:hypothetical protein